VSCRHWFFVNLQFAVQRAVLGMRRAELAAGGVGPQQHKLLGWEGAATVSEGVDDGNDSLDGEGVYQAELVTVVGKEAVRHSSLLAGDSSGYDGGDGSLELPPGLYDTAAPVQVRLLTSMRPW
jgi:hypothetical protein